MAMKTINIKDRADAQAKNLDLNDINVLDSIIIDDKSRNKGLIKALFFTAIAILVFFVPVSVGGNTDVVFGIIYNGIKDILGNVGLWAVTIVILGNGVLSVYGKFFAKKDSVLGEYYSGDAFVHPFLYLIGGAFILIYSLDATVAGFTGPNWLVSSATGGTVVPAIVLAVAWIIPVGAFFMPFLLDYGAIDFLGTLLEPIMRPVFKVPGYSAIDAMASFVSSSSVAVLITSRLYKDNVYTQKEAAIIATGFSAVSVGFGYMVIKAAGLAEYFLPVYFISLLMAFLVTAVMCRIPPLSRKPNVFFDGREQDLKVVKKQSKVKENLIKKGADRAIKKAYLANDLHKEIKSSLIDGYLVFPKVLSLLTVIGVTGLIVAEYTPFFTWIGALFVPLLQLLRIPNAVEIAPSFPIGIAEMFLPVLLIADKVEIIHIGARFMVAAVSMVQIIFFSETIVVMMATKLPIKLSELIICFIERTIIAIPIAALFMHLMF